MHSSRSRTPVALLSIAAILLAVAAPVAARADGTPDAASAGVGVARISLIQGAVAVQRGDSATPLAAVVNAPVLGADYVTTGDGARAEVQFDGASSVRLGAGVQMRFTHLDAAERELQLAAGTIDLRLLRGTDGRSQIDTPSISIRPRAAGSYRVSVDSAGRTYVTVRSGSAEIVTAHGSQPLVSGTTLVAQGAAANPVIESASAITIDDFDRFNRERDDRQERALANAAYTGQGVAGIDDLDAYGRWVSDGGYGRVWVPSAVASSWAPYRDGRWVWEDGYGWTWLGYEPWGWAPYHYGRWYHSSLYGWCWYPERAFVAWRPAVVAFLGFGNGYGFGFGDIGWVPLAPFEPFYAWWGNGYGNNVTYVTNNYYYGNVNNGTVTIVKNDEHNRSRGFGNMRYNGGTFVSHDRFLKGDFEHLRAVDPAKVRAIRPVRGVVPAVPTEANLRFSERAAPSHLTVITGLTGGTFAGNDIAVHRTPFAQQRETLANAVHVRAAVQAPPQHVTVMTTTAVPASVPARMTNAARDVNVTRETTDPWARFGASRGTPVSHTAASATVPVMNVNARAAGINVTRTTGEPDAWRHVDATRAAGVREATTVRQATPVREANARHSTTVQDAPRSVQHAEPQAAQPQHAAPPPAARSEHPGATKSTTPH